MKKSLPDPPMKDNGLFAFPYGALKWELLKTSIELHVYDHLTTPDTAEGLAAKLSAHVGNTELFLNALVALGCLSKADGFFKNTPMAQAFLSNGEDTSIGAFLLYMEKWIQPVLNGGMKELIQNGPSPAEKITDEGIWETGARVSLNNSRCGRAQKIAGLVAMLPEFASFSRILDLGAGPGVIGIAVASAHPSLECYLCDQPAVCRVAEEVIAEYGLEDRVRTLSGDYMNDPIGGNYDFIMANFTLNFYGDRLDQIMAKVYQALNPQGVFMVTSDGLTHEKTRPEASVISWLSTALQGMDMSFERGVVADAMLRAGFVSTQSQMMTDVDVEAHGPVDMIIGRKGQRESPMQ